MAYKAGASRNLVLAGGCIAGASLMAMALATPAGAIVTGSANSIIIGSGSSGPYRLMQRLDLLFNNAPGCPLFQPNSTVDQQLDISCVSPPTVAANPENPYNDISVQEPSIGSSNGIAELEDSGAHGATATSPNGAPGGINVFQGVNSTGGASGSALYARSARRLSSSDLQGLNFVAYAKDGDSWFHYTEVGGAATPSSQITNLNQSQLQSIYNGTFDNWDQVGGQNAPIVVFAAQEGSSSQATMKTYLGQDPSASSNQVNCATTSATPPTACVGPAAIDENSGWQIGKVGFTATQQSYLGPTGLWGVNGSNQPNAATNAIIQSDAIFFYSYGQYAKQCAAGKCGGYVLPSGTTVSLGALDGVVPSESSILESSPSHPNGFPVNATTYAYNVYSNGFNGANIPDAEGATLNYISEDGFLCKPQNATTIDRVTGVSYTTEIQDIILSAGYFPLSAGMNTGIVNRTPFDEGSVPHPASAIMPSSYAAFDPVTTGANGDEMGFCLVTTTDGNTNN